MVEPHWCLYDASSVLPHLTHVLQWVHSSLLLILGEEISTAQVATCVMYSAIDTSTIILYPIAVPKWSFIQFAVIHVCVQWNLCIKDTLGPGKLSFIWRCSLFRG